MDTSISTPSSMIDGIGNLGVDIAGNNGCQNCLSCDIRRWLGTSYMNQPFPNADNMLQELLNELYNIHPIVDLTILLITLFVIIKMVNVFNKGRGTETSEKMVATTNRISKVLTYTIAGLTAVILVLLIIVD